MMFDAQKLATIRSGLSTTYAAMFKRLPNQTNIIRGLTIPPYTVAGANDEQLWQRDHGDAMIYLAFAYLLTGDASYLTDCVKWVQSSCSYPAWGTGSVLNAELAAAHQLFGLALVYDWLQSSLDAATLSTIRQTLINRAPYMYNAGLNPKTSWATAYLNNHITVNVTGLFAAALALFDDPTAGTQALNWIDFCRTKIHNIEAALWPDGASLEGVTYWDYGMEYVNKYWTLSEPMLGEGPTSPNYAKAPWYRIYLTVPYDTWFFSNPMQVDIADCTRGEWYGPSPHIRRLGSITNNPVAQWYSDQLAAKGVDRYMDGWLNFIWYDASLASQSQAGLPTMRHFDNMGIVSTRSNWMGSESLVVFKCGPPSGHAEIALEQADDGAGHAHPDANHFVIFGNNEYLIRDDGYLDSKWSRNQNTLLVNGQGQMGEGSQFLVLTPYLNLKAYATVLVAQSAANLDYIVGEAAPAYSAAQGVKQFTRHLLFIKPSALVVIDDIQLSQAAPMELRFHTETAPSPAGTGVYTTQGDHGVMRMEVLTPDGSTSQIGADSVTQSEGTGTKFALNSVRLQRTGTSWRNVTAFTWAKAAPPAVTIQSTAAGYTVSYSGRQISFQWDHSPAVETTAVPVLRATQTVLPAFGGNPSIGFAPNGYIEIYGDNLSSQTTPWTGADFNGSNAPQALAGTQVIVNGVPAFVYFVSPKQVNVNLPADTTTGPVELQVINNGVPSNIVTVTRAAVAPAMLTTPVFLVNGKQYVVALLPTSTQNGPFVGPAGLISGVAFQPVKPGDRIVLYVLGAGPTSPATQPGVIAASSAKVSSSYTLKIGGQPATVEFFGLVAGSIGLYQLNAIVPAVGPGDQPIELTIAGVKDQQNLYLGGVQS
jgi:uncharacterized protein (TIGR03437 family)